MEDRTTLSLSPRAAIQALARPIYNPNAYAYRWRGTAAAYKRAAAARQREHLRRARVLAAGLEAPSGQRIPSATGYRTFPPATLDLQLDQFQARCASLIAERDADTAPKPSKPWIKHLLAPEDLAVYPEFLDLALHPTVLAIVTDYLGTLPVLSSAFFWHSMPVAAGPAGSQLLHCDHDDVSQVKLFVNVSDVDENCGPLQAFAAGDSERVKDRLHYTPGPKGHLPDELVEPLLADASSEVFIGPPGTMAFVDTSRCLHRGSRNSSGQRYLVVFQYVTPTSFAVNALSRVPDHPLAFLAAGQDDPLRRAVLSGTSDDHR